MRLVIRDAHYDVIVMQCMDKIFCVEFQSVPLRFRTKYLTRSLKDMTLKAFLTPSKSLLPDGQPDLCIPVALHYTVEVWECISNFIPHVIVDIIVYLCWD